MASLTYSSTAGGWVATGTDGPTVTPSASDDLIVPSGTSIEVTANLQFNSLTLGTTYGASATVVVDEGVTLTGAVTVGPDCEFQLGNNKNAPNGSNPASLLGSLTIQPGAGGHFASLAGRNDAAADVYSGFISGTVDIVFPSRLRIHNSATISGQILGSEGLSSDPGSVLTLDVPVSDQQWFTGAVTPGLRSGSILFSGASNGVTIPMAVLNDFVLSSANINNCTVQTTASSQIIDCALNNVQCQGVCDIQSGVYDAFSGTLSGPCTFNVSGGDVGFASCTVDPVTINLANALMYGEFGVGPVALTFTAGSVINASGLSQIEFDYRHSNTFTFGGTLNVLPASTLSISNPLGATEFTAGAMVIVGAGGRLTLQTALDNQTVVQLNGGTLEIDQMPANLGSLQFYTANSTLQIGTFGTILTNVTASLEDFSDSDTVIFYGVANATGEHVSLSGNTLQVFDHTGTLDATFTLSRHDGQTYSESEFKLAAGTGGYMTLSTTGVSTLVTPVITAGATANITAGGAAVVLDPGLSITDTGSATLAGATVSIGSNFLPGDTLNFADQNGITGTYNANTGVLTLSGTASLADYQSALASVSYSFSIAGADPTAGGGLTARTIDWVVNDGSVVSLPVTSLLNIQHVAPSISAGGTVSFTPGGPAVTLDPGISLSSIDSGNQLYSAVVSLGGGFAGAVEGLLADTTGTSITASYDRDHQALVLSGQDTLADYQAVLSTVSYVSLDTDPTDGGANPGRTLSWMVTDAATTSPVTSTALEISAQCFAAGTRILTTRGEVMVQDLRVGDRAITAINGSEAAVIWIGYREVDISRHPNPRSVQPVRIAAGAFGRGMPKRTLTLSPDHAVYVNDVLVPVKHLINGTTIRQVDTKRVTYYHVELELHDVIYADGMPAESYLDVGDRANFANGGPVVRLHMDLAQQWEAGGCAPLVVCGPALESARQLVAAHSLRLIPAACYANA